MKTGTLLLPILLCAAPAFSQDEVSKAPPRPSLLENKVMDEESASQAEPTPKPESAPEAKPEPEPKLALEPKSPMEPKPVGAEEEFAFAKAAAEDPDGAVQDAAMDELAVFVRRHPSSARAPEAILLLAGLKQKKGDWRPATASLLRLLYEYPGTKTGLRAKSDYLTLVDKKASRKQRQALNDLVHLPETSDKADRLSTLWQTVVETAPDALYEPVAEEIRDLTVRFPGRKDADRLEEALARLHSANDKPAASLLSWRKLLALYPESPERARAQMAIGDLYAGGLRDDKKAIDTYQELVDTYPQAPEVQSALENSAKIFSERLRQYALAVEMHEKIVKTFPKTPASLRALKSIANLQRERLNAPEEAITTLTRLAQMHGGQDGVDALLQAADCARRDLKDLPRQAEILRKVSDDYAGAKEAASALYDAAGVYESGLEDNAKAIKIYKEVASKFPSHRLAKRATDRAAKLEAK